MAQKSQNQIAQELEVIKRIMAQFPEGASLNEIKTASGLKLEPRTLQRRLEVLIDSGELKLSGQTRSAKYHLTEPQLSFPVMVEGSKVTNSEKVPLSPESQEILAALSIEFTNRKPVAYNRAFVDNYRPNINFYLSEQDRILLQQLSATPGGEGLPAGTYAKHILQRLLIDLSWNSSRLEGNTYSLLDTERLLSHGQPAPNKSTEEARMLLNHKEAIEFIVAGAGEIGFNRYTIQNLHAILSNDLLPDPAAPGRLRSFAVGIKKSAYTPTAIPQLIEEMFEVILAKASAITNPHEQALFAMVQLPYLQPFEDVNKRVSRLAANIPLNQHNLVPISFIGVPEDLYILGLLGVYELNRTELLKDIFVWACARSADRYVQVRQTIGAPNPFRLKYREIMHQLVTEIVSKGLSKSESSIVIQARALHVAPQESAQFRELIETELLSLHEGNFARYRVTPTEFKKWKETWNAN